MAETLRETPDDHLPTVLQANRPCGRERFTRQIMYGKGFLNKPRIPADRTIGHVRDSVDAGQESVDRDAGYAYLLHEDFS